MKQQSKHSKPSQLSQQNINLKNELETLRRHKENLEEILNKITSGKAFKLWQGFSWIKKSLLEKIKFVIRKDIFLEKRFIKEVKLKSTEKFSRVSIIIPTYNGEKELPNLLKAIDLQKGIVDPEVIVIDSESADKTLEVAHYFKTKIVRIKKKEFNHGLTRNLGAKLCRGKYIIFTVQDAIPYNRFTFFELLSLLTTKEKIIAASTKQIPYPDADWFAKWQIYNHINALHLDSNHVSTLTEGIDFYNLPFILKRKISLLDDVCSAFKKDLFFKVGGFKKIDFAEDLDFVIRALYKSFSIGFLAQNGVIHSHNRLPKYFLKRYYADNKIVPILLKETLVSSFNSVGELIYSALLAYEKVQNHLKTTLCKNSQLITLLKKIKDEFPLTEKKINYSEVNSEVLFHSFISMYRHANQLAPIPYEFSGEIKNSIEKLFAALIGQQFAFFVISQKRNEVEKKIDKILLSNI